MKTGRAFNPDFVRVVQGGELRSSVTTDQGEIRLPSGWTLSRFGDHFDVSMGQTILSKDTGESGHGMLPVYSATEKMAVFGHVPEGVVSKNKRLSAGDLVIGARGSLGFPKLMDGPSVSTQTTLQAKARGGFLAELFIHMSRQAKNSFFASSGTGVPMLTVTQVENIQLITPPLEDQKILASFLSVIQGQADDLREAANLERKRLAWLMDVLLSGMIRIEAKAGSEDETALLSMVRGDHGQSVILNQREVQIPIGWRVAPLGQEARVSKGKQVDFPVEKILTEAKPYAYINGGRSPSGYSDHQNTPGGAVAVSEGGASAGFVQFVRDPWWCGGHCYAVISEVHHTPAIYWMLKQAEQDLMGKKEGTGLPNLKSASVNDLELIWPPRDEQIRIAKVLDLQQAQIDDLDTLANLEEQRLDWLRGELLSGRLRVVLDPTTP